MQLSFRTRSDSSRVRPNPVLLRVVLDEERQGEKRNLWCPYYADCLDETLRLRGLDFSCARCPHQDLSTRPRAHEMDVAGGIGWEDLWALALAS
jgi:hypothetical protein